MSANDPARDFFDAIASRYDRAYALDVEATRARMPAVIARLPRSPARVIDLGVGTGRELPSLLDAGYDVTGLDFSKPMLAICARRSRAIPLVEADLWSPLPFADAAFDAAIALHGSLAHPPRLPDAHASLARELARVLRPGSPLVAEMPSRDWLVGLAPADEIDARLERTAVDACVHEDKIAHAAIEAIIPSDDEWRRAFEPWFTIDFEPIDERETRIVARRR